MRADLQLLSASTIVNIYCLVLDDGRDEILVDVKARRGKDGGVVSVGWEGCVGSGGGAEGAFFGVAEVVDMELVYILVSLYSLTTAFLLRIR